MLCLIYNVCTLALKKSELIFVTFLLVQCGPIYVHDGQYGLKGRHKCLIILGGFFLIYDHFVTMLITKLSVLSPNIVTN